jgi:hypothetical protein
MPKLKHCCYTLSWSEEFKKRDKRLNRIQAGMVITISELTKVVGTVPGRQGRQKIIPQKNAGKINKFIKYFVEINKNEVNKNCRQKTKENV